MLSSLSVTFDSVRMESSCVNCSAQAAEHVCHLDNSICLERLLCPFPYLNLRVIRLLTPKIRPTTQFSVDNSDTEGFYAP